MAESLKTILMSALTSKATPAESDTLIVGEGNVLKKISFSQLFEYLKEKLGINALNTKINSIGKTARFYAAGKFYVTGSSGNYSGLAIGETAWNNIVGVQFVGATDYKHYYTFPEGTYLVNINLFANLEASTSNVLGVALKIEVDDKAIANPWFRMIDSYQSIFYPVIISGSKLKVTMYSGKTIEIVNNANLSYIDFMRLN